MHPGYVLGGVGVLDGTFALFYEQAAAVSENQYKYFTFDMPSSPMVGCRRVIWPEMSATRIARLVFRKSYSLSHRSVAMRECAPFCNHRFGVGTLTAALPILQRPLYWLG